MTKTIGIDARAATEEGAGGGRFVRELVRALARRDDDLRYVLYARERWDEPLDERFGWHTIAARDPIWHWQAARAANRECDCFLSTNSYLTTWFLRIPAAAVVFDLVAFDPALRPQRRSGVIERLTLPPAVRRSAALIAISRATESALVKRFPRARGKTAVALLGAATALGDQAPHLPAGVPESGFILAVGTLEPRKNLPRLVAAYQRLPRALQEAHPLVVTGRLGWDADETLAALRALGERAVQTGFVTDAEPLRALPRLRRVRLPVARRGLRPAGPRGDGGRCASTDFGPLEPSRGGRRRRRVLRSDRNRLDRRRPGGPAARRGQARQAERGGSTASGRVLLGPHGRRDARGDRADQRRSARAARVTRCAARRAPTSGGTASGLRRASRCDGWPRKARSGSTATAQAWRWAAARKPVA